MNFFENWLSGKDDLSRLNTYFNDWLDSLYDESLQEILGINPDEFQLWIQGKDIQDIFIEKKRFLESQK